jgi:hypothetical protein
MMPTRHRQSVLVLAGGLLLLSTRTIAAERQIRPFIGTTFAGATTIVDPEQAVDSPNVTIGGSAVFLGELLGAEIDVADVPGMFESGNRNLVRNSRVTTFTGNIVIAAPHRLTEYALRPYVVAGGGLMRVRTVTAQNVFDIAALLPAFDAGVGAVGFVTNKVGVCWEVRRFQDLGRNEVSGGLSFGESTEQHLSFWRATMSVVIRY